MTAWVSYQRKIKWSINNLHKLFNLVLNFIQFRKDGIHFVLCTYKTLTGVPNHPPNPPFWCLQRRDGKKVKIPHYFIAMVVSSLLCFFSLSKFNSNYIFAVKTQFAWLLVKNLVIHVLTVNDIRRMPPETKMNLIRHCCFGKNFLPIPIHQFLNLIVSFF